MCRDVPGGVVVTWGLYVGLVYSQSFHTDWGGGDMEDIFLYLLCFKYFWGRLFLEGAVNQSKGSVWVVCQYLEMCQKFLILFKSHIKT